MLTEKLDELDKQYGGAIPFSALNKSKSKKKSKKESKKKSDNKTRKKSRKKKKKTVSLGRIHRKITKKLKRSKKKNKIKHSKNCSCGNGIHKYKGDEASPTGLGKCHECLPLNVVMKGKDGKLYENTTDGWIKFN